MKFWNKIEDIFAAVAFAEEGDADTARKIMSEGKKGVRYADDECCDDCYDAVSRPA